MTKKITYAVFYMAVATYYDPRPEWTAYCLWLESMDEVMKYYEMAKRNKRFAEVKIVKRIETFQDCEV